MVSEIPVYMRWENLILSHAKKGGRRINLNVWERGMLGSCLEYRIYLSYKSHIFHCGIYVTVNGMGLCQATETGLSSYDIN